MSIDFSRGFRAGVEAARKAAADHAIKWAGERDHLLKAMKPSTSTLGPAGAALIVGCLVEIRDVIARLTPPEDEAAPWVPCPAVYGEETSCALRAGHDCDHRNGGFFWSTPPAPTAVDVDIAELRALLAKATPGPCEAICFNDWTDSTYVDGAYFASSKCGFEEEIRECQDQIHATAKLIAAMHDALPALLDVAEAAINYDEGFYGDGRDLDNLTAATRRLRAKAGK